MGSEILYLVYIYQTIHNKFFKYYFEGSAKNVVSFIVKEKNLNAEEVEELKKLIDGYQNGEKS